MNKLKTSSHDLSNKVSVAVSVKELRLSGFDCSLIMMKMVSAVKDVVLQHGRLIDLTYKTAEPDSARQREGILINQSVQSYISYIPRYHS